MTNPIYELLTAEKKEEVFQARNTGIRRSPMRQLLDFLIANSALVDDYFFHYQPGNKQDQMQFEVCFNCMTRLYEARIGEDDKIQKTAMEMMIEK